MPAPAGRWGVSQMDLSTLLRAVWQFKITSLVIIVMTLAAAVGVLKMTPPTYTATSSYLIVAPPDPPTDAQLLADPSLRHLNYENPFNRYGSNGVILDVVAHTTTSDRERQAVVAAGGDKRYDVSPEATYGPGSSILDISVTANSASQALLTSRLVADAMVKEMQDVQDAEKVDPHWMFTTRPISNPSQASPVYSGTMRAVVGVMLLGGIVLILALSLRMGAAARRRPRLAPGPGGGLDDVVDDAVDIRGGIARRGKTDGVLETRHYRKAAL